ncbi:TonB-dependent receptor [Rhodocyclus gracilis]|nr:TonB-dependent receptor [Rhodocyclus gracilis]
MMLRMTPVALAVGMATLPQFVWAQAMADEGSRGETVLAPVNITATADTPTDLPKPYAGGQVATGARLGALGNLEVMNTPFNVTSYTAELIQDQQAHTLADVLANDPSVRFTTSSGHMYENFRVRGFDVSASDLAINGMFGLAPIGHTPVEYIERVEVLKGPSALFSGMAPSGGVGGVINLVPKRAGDDPLLRVSTGFQSDSQLGTSIDAGRRFGEQRQWGVRVNGALSNGDTTLDGQSKKREFYSSALDYRGESLTASLDAYHSKESFRGGTPAMFWFATPSIPKAPDPSTNQFKTGYGELESNAFVLRADYEFNEHLSAFGGFGMMNHDYSGFINGTHARQIDASGNYTGRMVGQLGYSNFVSSEAGVRSRFATGGVKHELVVQASNLKEEDGSANNQSTFASNIYNPITPVMVALPRSAPKTADSTLSSLALVDTLSFADDAVRLTLGLRNQSVKTTNFNATGAVTARYDKSVVTPAVGLVVKPWGPALSLYANYVQGLSKGDTVTDTSAANYGHVFAPYKTEQKEIGAKWDAGTFTHTLSLYQIAKPMMVSTGSLPSLTYTDEGEKRVRGVEWNTFGEVTRNVRVLGGVTYGQGVQTKTAGDLNNGKVAVGAPRWQGNIGTEWDTPWLSGVTLSARVQASGSQYLDSANTQQIAGWSQFDVGARYATRLDGRKLVLRANVVNLFDRHYYAGSFSDSTPIATLGQGRTLTASATMEF